LTSVFHRYTIAVYFLKKEGVMNTGNIIGVIVFAGILLLLLTPFASAQHIIEDEVWFTMKAVVNGHTLLTSASPFMPLSTTGTIFVRFWPTANRYEHNWEIWSQESNSGAWINVAGIVNIYGAGDGLILKWEPTWWRLPDLVVQQTSISGAMDIQRDDEVIKKATFISTGCWLQGQTKIGWFYGDCKLTGESIRKDTLPFPYQ
jgi:hypothetical protein